MPDALRTGIVLESRDDHAIPEPGSREVGALVGARMDEESARGDDERAEEVRKTDDLDSEALNILVRIHANEDVA